VTEELYRMMARQLDYAPAADELAFTVQVMIDDLERRGLNDHECDRVREAFRTLGPKLERWPTSRMVIEALPGRNPYRPTPAPMLPSARRFDVERWMADWLSKHPGSNMRDAAFAYMRRNRAEREENEREAQAEREAIKAE